MHSRLEMFTYTNLVVNFRPQKDDPYWIQITAGGNLLTYESNASVLTTNLDMAKMHWNSIVSTANARYMCLDIIFLPHCKTQVLGI